MGLSGLLSMSNVRSDVEVLSMSNVRSEVEVINGSWANGMACW